MTRRLFIGNGERLDVLLASQGMSRSRASALIRKGCATVEGTVELRPSFRPDIGDKVVLDIPEVVETGVIAEDIPIHILYEDDAIAIVVKPAGMVVHPGAGNDRGTLVNALLHHLNSLSGIGGERRPGIVHRLDKDTSGLLLVAKHDAAHAALSAQLAARQVEKRYLAVVSGTFSVDEGLMDTSIGRSLSDRKKMAVRADGRDALTRWRVLRSLGDRTLLDVLLVTGRTHQIRVHLASMSHPILGDRIYAPRSAPKAKRLMLHACLLAFVHPDSRERLRFFTLPDASFGLPEGWSPDEWPSDLRASP